MRSFFGLTLTSNISAPHFYFDLHKQACAIGWLTRPLTREMLDILELISKSKKLLISRNIKYGQGQGQGLYDLTSLDHKPFPP